MKYKTLGKTGLEISQLSYGASPLGSVFRNINEADGIKTVHTALDHGINYLDVSPYYGDTVAETVLGKALSTVSRDKYILSTKAGRYGSDFADFDFSEKRITASLDESMTRLNTDYIDILFLHDIEFGSLQQVLDESLPCLEKLKAAGKIGFIGVTGYPLKVFTEVAKHYSIDAILSYCRYSLNDTSLLNAIPALDEAGIGIINASPTSMGLLTERGAPPWHPAQKALVEASQQAVKLCQEHGTDITSLALQFAIDHPSITSTLVGTANPENIIKNVNWSKSSPDQALVAKIQKLFVGIDCTWPSGHPENQD
jgi:aryl-alcohol dehydrogenase-like predicted oxidoreductase